MIINKRICKNWILGLRCIHSVRLEDLSFAEGTYPHDKFLIESVKNDIVNITGQIKYAKEKCGEEGTE